MDMFCTGYFCLLESIPLVNCCFTASLSGFQMSIVFFYLRNISYNPFAKFNCGLFLYLIDMQSKSHSRSPDRNDRRGSSDRRRSPSERDGRRSSRERSDRSSRERDNRRSSRDRDDRSSRDRDGRRSSSEHKDSNYGKQGTRSNSRPTAGMVSNASDGSSAGPSEKQLNDQQGKIGAFHPVSGVKKEPPRRVTADEAAAIVMAATRGLGAANDSLNTIKGKKEDTHIRGSNDHSSSFGSFSSLQDRDVPSKHISNSEADTSLTNSGQLKKEGFGIIDDDWIANTIAKAVAVAASKEADSSEASMTKEQKLKAERLRRAKMFTAIIKGGGNKMNDLAAVSDQTDEPSEAAPADMNASALDPPPEAKEREGSSAPIEFDVLNVIKEKDSDDEQNRVRQYRKKHHRESDEEKDEAEESYKHSRKRHRSEHSRGHSKDAHKHKHKSHSKDRESRHRRHQHSSSEDEMHWSSKSRHRHRDDDRYSDYEEHNRSHRHRREHRSSSKRKHEEERDQSEQIQGHIDVSPSTSGAKLESDKPTGDASQSSQGATEVPSDLRAKIRAMLMETL